MTIKLLKQSDLTNITTFDKNVLKILKPYFDIDLKSEQFDLFFKNLLTLATHSLGIAHCVQHNHAPRLSMLIAFENKTAPGFFQNEYEKQIGCNSNLKKNDSLKLVNNVVLLIRLTGEVSLFYSTSYSSFSLIYFISTIMF